MSGEFVSAFFPSLPQIEKFSLADPVDSCQSPVLLKASLPNTSNLRWEKPKTEIDIGLGIFRVPGLCPSLTDPVFNNVFWGQKAPIQEAQLCVPHVSTSLELSS